MNSNLSTSYPTSSSDEDDNDDGFIKAEGPDLHNSSNVIQNIENKQDDNNLKISQVC